MTAKDYLNQAFWLDRRIHIKLERLSALNEIAARSTSVTGEETVRGPRNVHAREDAMVKIADMKTEIEVEIRRLMDLKAEIEGVIRAVEDPECQTLLELRYLCYRGWTEIAEEMHCCESNVYKVHTRALQAVRIPDRRAE